jgi:hypothetical protein
MAGTLSAESSPFVVGEGIECIRRVETCRVGCDRIGIRQAIPPDPTGLRRRGLDGVDAMVEHGIRATSGHWRHRCDGGRRRMHGRIWPSSHALPTGRRTDGPRGTPVRRVGGNQWKRIIVPATDYYIPHKVQP